ncbi:hypothetical protein RI054_16g76780 [Pseudoscourfieldia marina]
MTHLKREKSRKHYGRHTKRFGQKEIRRARNDYRRRFKAVVEQLEEVGFYNIERDIKLENLEEIDEETWLLTSRTPYRPDGTMNIETTMHQDPAPNLQSLERILTEFFPGTPDNMKIALLMRTVNTDKYRGILDSMKIPGMVIPTYLELKQASREPLCDRSRRARAKMKGGKRKARRRKIAHQSRRSRLMPLWQAVAAEVRRPSRKTRRRSLRMKGFLNSSVHSVQQAWANHDRTYHQPAPTHALEEDADAEAVVRREAADEDTAADTPVWTDRHQGR